MMTDLGHEVFLYGGTKNEARATEFISVVSDEDRSKWFNKYDFDKMVFNEWDDKADCWKTMNRRAADEISQRKQKGDILGLIAGLCQQDLIAYHSDLRAVEWGIGYEGIIPSAFHVFESNAWMHWVYGKYNISDGRFFDAVIPNSFDPEDYIYSDDKEDYLLYLGRPTARKGLEVIKEIAAAGHRVIAAGQGELDIKGVEHVGVVRGLKKAQLLAKAKAVLVPTFYIEPFGGVAVEAMLSGTPVITTDFGAFTETVVHKETGFRCHTVGEFLSAVRDIGHLSPIDIRLHASQYLTGNIKHSYDSYFKRLSLLDQKGWYS